MPSNIHEYIKPKQKVRKLTPKDTAVPKINPADDLIEMSVPGAAVRVGTAHVWFVSCIQCCNG